MDYLFYSYFSGQYVLKPGAIENERPVYYERGRDPDIDPTRPPGKFSYCASEEAWVFSIDTITKGSGVSEDECNWLLKSPKTSSFDLSAVGSSGWTIWTGVVTPPPVSFFLVSCDECSSEADCNYHGSCSRETKHCICDPGWMGTTCILDDICEEIAAGAAGDSADRLVLLRDETDDIVSLYDRPVYYNTYYNVDDGSHNATALFLYLGRRWYDIETPLLPEEVVEYAKPEHFFHAYWDAIYEYNTWFFSEPTTESTPVGLEYNELIDFSGDFGAYGNTIRVDWSVHCVQGTCDRCSQWHTLDCVDNVCICEEGGCLDDGHSYKISGYFCHKATISDEPVAECTDAEGEFNTTFV